MLKSFSGHGKGKGGKGNKKKAILNNFKVKFHNVLKFAFIFSRTKKNVEKNVHHLLRS